MRVGLVGPAASAAALGGTLPVVKPEVGVVVVAVEVVVVVVEVVAASMGVSLLPLVAVVSSALPSEAVVASLVCGAAFDAALVDSVAVGGVLSVF